MHVEMYSSLEELNEAIEEHLKYKDTESDDFEIKIIFSDYQNQFHDHFHYFLIYKKDDKYDEYKF